MQNAGLHQRAAVQAREGCVLEMRRRGFGGPKHEYNWVSPVRRLIWEGIVPEMLL